MSSRTPSGAVDRLTLLCLFSPLVVTAWDQSHWWREKEDYTFGWLTPLFVIYVLHDRWSALTTPVTGPRPAPSSSGAWIGGAAFAFGAGLFVIGALYRAAAGLSYGGTLALTLGSSITLLSGSCLAARAAGRRDADLRRWAALLVFPALIWLVSAPMLTVVESTLSNALRARITEVVFGFYDLLGFSIEQQGNVLLLPSGQVGVEEACSGIRSLTGCLFAGSFLAATFVRRTASKISLVIASLVLAFVSNLLRGLFLTGWALAHGSHSIEGRVHDLSGYAVLGLTVVLLFLLMPWIERSERRTQTPSTAVIG